MKKLKLNEKSVYGKVLIYVTDFADQATITTLTGRKTLTELDVKALIRLGVDVEVSRLPESK